MRQASALCFGVRSARRWGQKTGAGLRCGFRRPRCRRRDTLRKCDAYAFMALAFLIWADPPRLTPWMTILDAHGDDRSHAREAKVHRDDAVASPDTKASMLSSSSSTVVLRILRRASACAPCGPVATILNCAEKEDCRNRMPPLACIDAELPQLPGPCLRSR